MPSSWVEAKGQATHTVIDQGVGSGPPLILVHGVGLDHTMWDLVAEPMTVRLTGPSQVVRYDLLGHGRTGDPQGKRTMSDFIDQLLAVVDAVGSPRPPDVVGLSLGGGIVRGAAARFPRVFGRVVITNTVFNRNDDQRQGNLARLRLAEDQGMSPIADLAIDRWFSKPWQVAHHDRASAVGHRLASTDLGGYLKAYQVFVDGDPAMPDQLPSLTNETLVVTGDRDLGSTPAMAEAMVAALPAATARVLSDAGHVPPIECPEAFVDLLIDFLENPHHDPVN